MRIMLFCSPRLIHFGIMILVFVKLVPAVALPHDDLCLDVSCCSLVFSARLWRVVAVTSVSPVRQDVGTLAF